MKIGSWKTLSAAAVAAALALPAYAQQGESAAGQTGGARSSNAGQNDEASGAGQAGASGRSRAAGRASAADDAAPQGSLDRDESGSRTANFPPQGDDRGTAAGGQGQGGQRGQLSDQGIVRWIAAGNEAEIRINEAAQQKAQNEQVKQFAQRMVEEHTKLGQQLQQATQDGQQGASGQQGTSGQQGASGRGAASGQGASGAAAGTATGETQERTARRIAADAADDAREAAETDADSGRAGNRQGRGAAMRGGNNPFLALHEQIKRQCAESTIQALNQKQGAEFDHAFMHQQVVEHMTMLDTLKVAQQHASPNLKQALQQAEHHTQQHLDQAKQIVEQLDKEGQRQ